MGTRTVPSTDVLATRPVWLVSALAGLAAAIATELYGLAARAVGLPMEAGNIGASVSGPITIGMFAMGTAVAVFWGTVLAVLLARHSRRPARAYLWTTVALTAVSMAGPVLAGATVTSTKLMLALAHILAAAIVIPVVTRRLSHSPAVSLGAERLVHPDDRQQN
ncbi:DUF6069 family protein [Micromonospora sp. NPDC023737]|uniref:DUF6069 family protein n=1 Tax=unclassified Micromonospora TaxID=2617518 RepID=UPI0033EE6813